MDWETLLEGEHKAFGSHEPHPSPHPSLSKAGRANPEVRQSADRGFLSIQANYRSKIRSFLRAWGQRRQKERGAEALTLEYFTKAFQRGILSRGGLKRTPRDLPLSAENLRWINKASREEAGYLLRFAADHGRLTQAQTDHRVEMYVKTLEGIFTAGKVSATPDGKYILIRWIIDPRAESCPGCIYLSKIKYFTKESLPCVPKDGTTPCLSFCKCKLKFETVDAARYNQVLRSWVTKRQHLARLGSFHR